MPAHPDPVAVALVSGSLDDLNWFQDKFKIREWKVIELDEFCKEEYTDAFWKEDYSSEFMLDYTDEFVIRKVVGLDGFPVAVAHSIECVASSHAL